MVSALDYHFRGPGFKTTIWYLGRLNLYPSEVDIMNNGDSCGIGGKK